MERINKNHILLFILIVAISPYCYLCFFANPSADDFTLAAQFQQNDFFALIYEQYFVRNGRYISSPLSFLNPISFNSFYGYKVVPFLFLGALFFSQLFFITQLFTKITKSFKVILSFLFFFFFLHNMPIISEGIYWYTGGVIYTLGVAVFLFYIGFLIKVLRDKLSGFWLVLLTFLLFFSCGFNEVLTLLIVFLLAVVTFVFYQKNLELKRVVLTQLLFSILFASILIFAPGNAIRGNSYSNTHQFFHSFGYSILQVVRFSLLWIVSIPLIVASILYAGVNKTLRKNIDLFKNSFYINRWFSIFLMFSIVFICVFPAYWATGILGQHRTLNVAYFFFLIMWFVNLTVWLNHYQNKIKRFKINLNQKKLMMLVLVLGLVFTGNGYSTLHDVFSGKARSFNLQITERFEKLSKERKTNGAPIILGPLLAKPKCLFTYDISSNPKDWKNQAFNMYFGLEGVDIYLNNKSN